MAMRGMPGYDMKPRGIARRRAGRTVWERSSNASHHFHDRAVRAAWDVRAQAGVWIIHDSVQHSAGAAVVGGTHRDCRRDHLSRDPHREPGYGVTSSLTVVRSEHV